MSYNAEISRKNPSSLIFLVDQSGSMEDVISGIKNRKKADEVAIILNKCLMNLVINCSKGDDVRDYYHVGVIGYGEKVGSIFAGELAGKGNLIPLSLMNNNPSRIEEKIVKVDDGAGGIIEQKTKFPVWFDSIAASGTPMCEAIFYAQTILEDWINQHPNSFPPIVINITDGESTDGDPSLAAEKLKQISTSDGNVLLFNAHVSSRKGDPITYPDSAQGLPDEYARTLFQMSSMFTTPMQNQARVNGYSLSETSRGFVFNADPVTLIDFLKIGTTPTANLR